MREINVQEMMTLQSQGKKLLVDFKAQWCMPCKSLIPRLEVMSEQYPNVEFVMIDVDDNKEEAIKLGLRSVPTVMIFNGENLLGKISGAKSDEEYKQLLDKL
jgi:thioredoxin 1